MNGDLQRFSSESGWAKDKLMGVLLDALSPDERESRVNYPAAARPADRRPAETDEAALKSDFGSCFYIWHSDRWRASGKGVFCWSHADDTAAGLRTKLGEAMARAVPELREQLKSAEAAAERLRRGVVS